MDQVYHEDDIDMHAKGDYPLSDRHPPWRRSPRRCDSTTEIVLLADGMVRPSHASKHIDVPTSVLEIGRDPLTKCYILTCIRDPSLMQCMLCPVVRGGD